MVELELKTSPLNSKCQAFPLGSMVLVITTLPETSFSVKISALKIHSSFLLVNKYSTRPDLTPFLISDILNPLLMPSLPLSLLLMTVLDAWIYLHLCTLIEEAQNSLPSLPCPLLALDISCHSSHLFVHRKLCGSRVNCLTHCCTRYPTQ